MLKQVMRKLALALVAIIGAAGLLAGGAVAASASTSRVAATCSGYGCDGQNPYGTGCFSGSEIIYDLPLVDAAGIPNGRVRLWYSPGCRTVWASIYDAPAGDGAGQGSADIHRNSDNHRFDCGIPAGKSSCYTAMLYDGGVTSHAHAVFSPGTSPGTASATTPNF